WHIVADLTPPELLAARKLRIIRFGVIVALAVVVAAGAGGYLLTQNQAVDAAADLQLEQALTATLRTQQQDLSGVTRLQARIAHTEERTAQLMASDVDFDALLGNVWQALPDSMTIDQISATVPAAAGDASRTHGQSGFGRLDPS